MLLSDLAGNNQTIDFENEHVNALVLRYHKRLVDLLCAKDCKEVNEKAQCDAFDNCPYRKNVGKDYDCKMAVWEVLQGESQAKCPYAIALQTMGLWQNQLVVDVNQ